ncbi:hypothetical protein [Caenimonas soli]|uniref:hypothetical protein n=1 Tax=Caenimonas soli TaxID=2735555 RepID=UPI002E2B372F|nr:hypothetical protein [Caenimonas soli]
MAAAFLLMPVAATIMALPLAAQAQPAATPEVEAFEVTSDGGLRPGAQLKFKVEGTPRAQASIRIRGVERNIPLREVARGVYVGRYTVSRNDRISEDSAIRAMIRLRNRTAVASYTFPEDIARAQAGVRPPGPAVPPPVAVAPLKIERFSIAPVDRIEPGAELKFSLAGVPGANVDFDIPGVAQNVPMREVRPGVYEGSYTVKRLDNLAPSRPIVATMRLADRTVTQALTQPLIADARPPVIRHLSPREGETIVGRGATVSGTFDDAGGLGVDPKSVRIRLSGRDVTAQTQITPQHFTYRADLPAGRHTVDVAASDLAGNAVRRSWSFDVAASVAAIPVTVPLQVTSHANNAQVSGSSTVIQGRTAPGAFVDVKVSATASLVGLFGVSQPVSAQRVQADGNGNFSFSFTPQLPLPGTRYEVTLVSTRGDVRAESTLVLFQRQG